ncbi:hypothetical protein DASC09_028630 [Saccharomycopsis crataegensis]|uniref:ribonuclease T2 n=1 Tax=Saccharomycopsis crataegensis TaxID=43959 RepID=A0AAV5QKZ4_9ASCO|nr:hypothetical protein DASC09_028630 [Saccharomycopsis crataegensis]
MKFIYSIPALSILLSAVNASPIDLPPVFKRDLDLSLTQSQCTSSGSQVSCSTSGSSGSDSCCVESEGLILQTQFWDTDVSGSPENTWTIHGLWPDKCDGSYDANCDFSSQVSSVSDVLQNAGETDLVNYMSQYWLNNNGDNEELWTHEFNKHGTCMSTLGTQCYASGTASNTNVVDFAKLVVKTYQGLPTYQWLAKAGITPSSSKTYSADEISAALKAGFGNDVFIGCSNGAFNQVWYFHTVQGSLLNDDLVKIDAVSKSTCSGHVKYLPRQSN